MTQTTIHLVAGLWQSKSSLLESLPDPHAYFSLPPATALGSGALSFRLGNREVPVRLLLPDTTLFPPEALADGAG